MGFHQFACMGGMTMLEIGLALLGVVFSVIGYLLRKKDEEQARQIALLFSKHDADALALQELRVQLAREHYQKSELDARFDKLEAAFRAGFSDLGVKFDRLSEALMERRERPL